MTASERTGVSERMKRYWTPPESAIK